MEAEISGVSTRKRILLMDVYENTEKSDRMDETVIPSRTSRTIRLLPRELATGSLLRVIIFARRLASGAARLWKKQ